VASRSLDVLNAKSVGLADGVVRVHRGTILKEHNMPALLDIALAIIVLVGAFFLGSCALAIFKEVKKDGNNDNKNTPST
jgi:hypothetical protein